MLLYSLGVFKMINIYRLFILFFVLSFSGFSYSVDYYWQIGANGNYGSMKSACDAWGATYVPTSTARVEFQDFKFHNPSVSAPIQAQCRWKVVRPSDGAEIGRHDAWVYRRGDSCTPPKILDPAQGSCVNPPEPCKVGDLFPSKGSVGPVITSDNGSKHVSSNPQTMCQNQCEYADPTARPSGCYALPGDQGYCNFIIKGTGNNCFADNYEIAVAGDRLNPPDTPNVPDSSPDPICPPGWSSSGGTCFKNPPKFCDPSTGEICAPGTTDPNKPAPDAGTGGTEGTPGEGEGGRPDSSNGADKDLQDLQDSKPDAEACKPAADGSGCSGSTVKGEQCDKVVECTGDAVQCSILRQQKKMACAYEYEEARPFIEQQIAKEPYQVKSESVSGSELFTAGLNAPRWMPQGCPAPKSISIKGVSTSLSFEPACDFARSLGPLFVALASIFFAVYVGRAFGGN